MKNMLGSVNKIIMLISNSGALCNIILRTKSSDSELAILKEKREQLLEKA